MRPRVIRPAVVLKNEPSVRGFAVAGAAVVWALTGARLPASWAAFQSVGLGVASAAPAVLATKLRARTDATPRNLGIRLGEASWVFVNSFKSGAVATGVNSLERIRASMGDAGQASPPILRIK